MVDSVIGQLAPLVDQLLQSTKGFKKIGLTGGVGPEEGRAGNEALFVAGFDEGHDFLLLVAIGRFPLAVGKVQLEFQNGAEVLNEERR